MLGRNSVSCSVLQHMLSPQTFCKDISRLGPRVWVLLRTGMRRSMRYPISRWFQANQVLRVYQVLSQAGASVAQEGPVAQRAWTLWLSLSLPGLGRRAHRSWRSCTCWMAATSPVKEVETIIFFMWQEASMEKNEKKLGSCNGLSYWLTQP